MPEIMEIEFKISNEIPEIYKKCHEVFGVNWEDGLIITYGDTVYCSSELDPSLIIHEGVHVKQQKEMGPEKWWDKYFVDKEFRLSQEVEAYKAQIRYIKLNVKDRNTAFKICHKIWQDMVRMYGGMCTYEEAKKLTS